MHFLAPLLLIQGVVLGTLTVLMLFPLVFSLAEATEQWHGFLASALLTSATAVICLFSGWRTKFSLSTRQLFVMTTMSWFVVSAFAALPFILTPVHRTYVDAFFEAASGLTTTGSTVLSGLENLPPSTLLWRAELQWMGGIGIIVFAIAILPFLEVGGMRLFHTESSDWSDKLMPRSRDIIRTVGVVYLVFTAAIVMSYWLAGMLPFDALVHSMTTISTGGFSTYDVSLGHYANHPGILWLTSFFMMVGSLPFLLYVRFIRGDTRALWRDQQVRGFVLFVAMLVIAFSLYRAVFQHENWFHSFTHTAFNVISIVTTTGYVSEDYSSWGTLAFTVFFYITFVGGCSGSTSGAIKTFRFQIALMMFMNQIKWMLHPRGIFVNRYNGRLIGDDIGRSVVAFSFFYALTVAVLALALAAMGLDLVTSLSGAATAVGNVGPGLGDIIGPAGNFAALPNGAKWLLAFGMLLGRLEIFTVLIILTPAFWRN